MRDPLSKLSPATHRVIAAALLHERAHGGRKMTAARITSLCEEAGASLGACLAVVLGMGLDGGTGKPARLDGSSSSFRVPDDETVAALDWRERIAPS